MIYIYLLLYAAIVAFIICCICSTYQLLKHQGCFILFFHVHGQSPLLQCYSVALNTRLLSGHVQAGRFATDKEEINLWFAFLYGNMNRFQTSQESEPK